MSTKPTTFNSTVRISVEEFEYLKQCEKELFTIKDLIGEMIQGGKA